MPPNEHGNYKSGTEFPTAIDDVEMIQRAISSGDVTATEMCMAYINR
jgi:hypothetical protein